MKKIVVNAASQEAVLYDGDSAIRLYVVSTAKNGLGCGDNSLCTPNGKLRIAEKIGDGLPIGTILRGGEPTKKVWSSDPSNPLSTSQDDFVLSRILRLRGCELGNANTLKRCIYIHGTNHENLLGQPASHGCIRMSNTDGIELFDLVEVGDEVDVTAGHEEVAETQVWEAPLIGPRFQGRAALTLRPLMAQSRHTQCADECPLLGRKAHIDQPLLTSQRIILGFGLRPAASQRRPLDRRQLRSPL